MIETVILLLIQICILALVVFLVTWVLGMIGVTLPPRVVQILWVIFALIVILLLYRAVMGAGGVRLWPL